jgi:alpha/beta superfamily hydrolase
VRVVILDAQPIQIQRQEYRLVDAATGEFERGYVDVDDMVTTQPWADDLPVHVQHSTAAGQA